MKIPILLLALVITSCGPAPDLPNSTWQGEVTDYEGQMFDCTIEITLTAPDRVHLHLDYGDQCDGDGAFIIGDVLLPDAGGEILIETHTLRGNFFSALGYEYRIEVSPEGAK